MNDIKVPNWLADRKAHTWNKVVPLKQQLRETDNTEWQRDRMKKWLHQAQLDYSWLSHWVTKT
jgi:hypothetical protein